MLLLAGTHAGQHAKAHRSQRPSQEVNREVQASFNLPPDQALLKLANAVEMARTLKDRVGEAEALSVSGLMAAISDRRTQALAFYGQALVTYVALKDRRSEGQTQESIGEVYLKLRQPTKAIDHFNTALGIVTQIGERDSEAAILSDLGDANVQLGQLQSALEYFAKALKIERDQGDMIREYQTLAKTGAVYSSQKQFAKALDCYQKVVRISSNMDGEDASAANTGALLGMAYSYVALGKKALAVDTFAQARPFLTRKELAKARATTHNLLIELGPKARGKYLNDAGRALGETSQANEAVDYLTQALPLLQGSDKARALLNLGAVYQRTFKWPKAQSCLTQALTIFDQAKDKEGLIDVLGQLVGVCDQLHQKAKVQEYLARIRLLREHSP
jgi:tetratricopeptide (TPR) repeat protein